MKRGHLGNAWRGLREEGVVRTWDRAWDFVRRRAAPRPVLQLAVPAGMPRFEPVADPVASILVPVYNNLDFSLECLRALAASADSTPFEVIVVDDASTDATREVLQAVPGVTFFRNPANAGFIRSCNAGARLARGRYLVLLNNDTVVQPGWLDELLATFQQHPDTGLVGSRLLYPDATLQEAGCVIFSDGRAGNYGRMDAALDPRYSCVRDADYCSGAAVAVPLALFRELGGFDERYCPAYYEDADLAMRVRQSGHAVRYQPHSWVVHMEGLTSGLSEEHGTKAYQRINRTKFALKWAKDLEGYPAWGVRQDRAVARGPRRLIVAGVPDQCVLIEIEGMLRMPDGRVDVSLFIERGEFDADTTRRLQSEGVEVWQGFWSRFPLGWVRRYGWRFGDVHIVGSGRAVRWRRWFGRHAPGVPVSEPGCEAGASA